MKKLLLLLFVWVTISAQAQLRTVRGEVVSLIITLRSSFLAGRTSTNKTNVMKKFGISLLLAGLAIAPAMANQLSPEEALKRLDKEILSTRGMTKPELAFTKKNDFGNAIYIFNTSPGMIIVSADDVARPLLGYTTSGSFERDNVPPAFNYWLEFYAAEIEGALLNEGAETATPFTRAGRNDIVPLVTAQWNQNEPYNKECPVFNNSYSMTGCVATAMGQIMYYHQWPARAEGGMFNYTSEYSRFKVDLSINFDEVVFDWDNMLDNYASFPATEQEIDAVAQLMKVCGYAVRMNYSPSFSAAYIHYIGEAFYSNFGYSSYTQTPQRQYYTDEEWENMIYNQLSHGYPVMYGGYSIKDEGHQFICDGYEGDGYFHINWGWGGLSDGYFLLSALNPGSQGIGGGTSGYDYKQEITMNITLPGDELEGSSQYLVCCMDDFVTQGIGVNPAPDASESVLLRNSVTFPSDIVNYGCRTTTGQFGILLISQSGDKTELYLNQDIDIQPFYSFYNLPVFLPADLSEGTYTVWPIFKISGEAEYMVLRCPISKIQSLNMSVANGRAVFSAGTIANGEEAGVKTIPDYDDNKVTYYNLQGIEVKNPKKGELLIMKKGRDTRKIIY